MKIKRLVEQHLIMSAGRREPVDTDNYNCTLLAENNDYYVYEIHDAKAAQALGDSTDWGIALDDDTIVKNEWNALFNTKSVVAAPKGKSKYKCPAKKVVYFIPKPPFNVKPYMLLIGSYLHDEPDKVPPFQFITHEDMGYDKDNRVPPNINFPTVNIDGISIGRKRGDDGQIVEDGELIDLGMEATKAVFPKGQTIIDNVCAQHEELRSVVLPDSVKVIQAKAFYDCVHLVEINFPDGLHTIEQSAFVCTAIPIVDLPDSVVEIGPGAFNGSGTLSMRIPNNLKELPQGLCRSCEFLKEVTGGDSLERIGLLAFEDCVQLSKFNFGPNLTFIGEAAFDNTALEEVVLPDSISAIHTGAFKYCQHLKKVKLPSSLATLGDDAFSYTGLESIEIPGSIKNFGTRAFSQCSELKSVTIKNGLVELGAGAFMGDSTLNTVDLGSSLVYIGTSAFASCGLLESIKLPSTLRGINESAFANCSRLERIDLPDGLLNIGEKAFLNCFSLRSITLPRSLVTIESECFLGCRNLTDVYYAGTQADFVDTVYARNVRRLFIGSGSQKVGAVIHCKDGDITVN